MRKIIFGLVALLIVAGVAFGQSGVSGFPRNPKFGNVAVTGSVTSTKTCAAGFTRTLPSYCRKDVTALAAWTNTVACTARTFGGAFPADARLAHVAFRMNTKSSNAVGARTHVLNTYNNAACTQFYADVVINAFEHVGVAAGTTLTQYDAYLAVPLVATDTIRTTQTNTGGNGNGQVGGVMILGYFD